VPTLSPSSSNFPIAYIELRVFSHATEDLEKVEAAVKNIFPEPVGAVLKFNKISLTGHHGNPIVHLDAKLEDRAVLPSVMQKIGASLSPLDKVQLAEEFAQHIEKHNLFLRFDKQTAYLGNTKTATNDPIHLKVHFKNLAAEGISEFCRQAGLLP
jgi:RNA binding exosome subunit